MQQSRASEPSSPARSSRQELLLVTGLVASCSRVASLEHPTRVDVPAGALRPPAVPARSSPAPDAPVVSVPESRRSPLDLERLVGAVIEGRYRVEGVLAEGGMGVVYRARHLALEKRVAIKVLQPRLAARVGAAERFLAEARAVSAIGSPHIVDAVDFGTLPDGLPYLVMEYVDGPTLAALLRGSDLGLDRALEIAIQIAEGLEPAHAAGVIHRDLKPDNVLVLSRGGRDHVKVLDFGVAKVTTGASDPAPGCVVGTPHYMSPEQAIGAEVDERADIYSLGVMLYEMVTGALPFQASSGKRVMELHVTTPPAPPSSHARVGGGIPAALEALILGCLAKDPTRRPSTMRRLRARLEQLKAGYVPRVIVTPEPPRELGPADSWPTLADSPRALPHSATVSAPHASGAVLGY